MLSSCVFLTPTDTTLGFVSQNPDKLTQIKQRPPSKHYIKAVSSLKILDGMTRIPSMHKKRLRRAHKTTFVLPDTHSYRVIRDKHHLQLLSRLKWAYTTSANLSGENYDEAFAISHADAIVMPLTQTKLASHIIKLGKTRMRRIR